MARAEAEARKRAAKGEFQLPLPEDGEGVTADGDEGTTGGHLSAVPDAEAVGV